MNDMKKIAKRMDTFCRILKKFSEIAAIVCLVFLVIVGAAFVFDISPEKIGTGYDTVEIGFVELKIAEDLVPGNAALFGYIAVQLALTVVLLVIVRRCIVLVREILLAMTQGEPFKNIVSLNLRKLAVCSVLAGIASNAAEIIGGMLAVQGYNLEDILLSENILHVTFNYTFDMGFLVPAAILLLLSYVFRYGEQLQQLSDETL